MKGNNTMKKFFCILVSFILTISCLNLTAFASEFTQQESGSGSIKLESHLYSSFDISFPAVLRANNGDKGFITVTNARMEENYEIWVNVNNVSQGDYVGLIHTDGTTGATAKFKNDETFQYSNGTVPLVTFTYDDFLEQDYCEKSFTVEVEYHESRKPGDYTGTMQYNFALTYVG